MLPEARLLQDPVSLRHYERHIDGVGKWVGQFREA